MQTALYAAAAAGSLALAFVLGADGLLGLALPWIGAAFYAGLAVLAARKPESPWLTHGSGFAVFVHASLLAESFLAGRLCWGCVAVAAFAFGGGAAQFARRRADGVTLALSLLLGATSGFFEPFDRVDGALTRSFWPAKVFSIAPAFVDRGELAGCAHGRPVRLLLYEKDCKTWGSADRKFTPRLAADFPTQVCVHAHDLPAPPPGQRLPVFVLTTPRLDVVVIEGMPSYEELKAHVDRLLTK